MIEIYLDNAATTKTHKEVASVAVDSMCQEYGNPSSLHNKGFAAQKALEKARNQVAAALGVTQEEIFFTSGGTEANNLAILGGVDALKRQGNRIVTTKVEHASVLEPIRKLGRDGYEVVELEPLKDGSLDIEALVNAVDSQTILVSAMMVNSEIGSISPIAEGVRQVKRKNPDTLFHTDGVQGFGKIPFSAARLGVDFLSLSGHKIYSPKGVGALYVKKGSRLNPRTYGGGQENHLRPGTENTSGICALGHGAWLTSHSLNENFAKVRGLCKYFINKAEKSMGLRMNSTVDATPYICNLSVQGYRSEVLLHYLGQAGIYVSSGSACSKGEKSHVLSALGLSNQRIDSALRISFSPSNTTEEIDRFFQVLQQGREQLIRS